MIAELLAVRLMVVRAGAERHTGAVKPRYRCPLEPHLSLSKIFEIAIYNQKVREMMERGERHRDLSDAWADIHYIEVEATSERDARTRVAGRYPASQGYVIVDVSASKFDED